MKTSRKVMEWLICFYIVNLMLGCLLFKESKKFTESCSLSTAAKMSSPHLKNILRDPDLNYFKHLNFNNFDSPYVLYENVKRYLCDINKYGNLSLIHVNTRSMNSNFKKLNDFLLSCPNSFNIVCVTETWSTDNDIKNNSNFHLPNFDFIHQERKSGNLFCCILIYVMNHLKFNLIKDLSVSDGNGFVTVKIENKNSKNVIITLCYRPPGGAIKGLNRCLENVFKKVNAKNKLCFVAGDFSLNCLGYNKNLEIRTFYNRVFVYGSQKNQLE